MITETFPLRATFLGTGTSTGVPVLACDCEVCQSDDPRDKRLRSSLMIEYLGRRIVIDCGPDFRYQMIREKVDDLDAILLTHHHRDHIAGLDDIRGFNYVLNKSIDVFAEEKCIEAIRAEFPYIFNNTRYFGAPQINFRTITNQPFRVEDIPILPIRAMHQEMEILGFRIGGLSYITDASAISPDELRKLEGSDIIILNALRNSTHPSHFSVPEAIEIIQALKPAKGAYLTHMSHFIDTHKNLDDKLPEGIHPAYDGLRLSLKD